MEGTSGLKKHQGSLQHRVRRLRRGPIVRPPRNAQGLVRVIARGEGGRGAGHDRAERTSPSRAERSASRTARGTPRRGVLIHQLRVLVGVERPHAAPPPWPFCPSAVPLPTPNDCLVSLRPPCFSLVPSPSLSLVASSCLYPSLSDAPGLHPRDTLRAPRTSTVPLAAIYPNRANAQPSPTPPRATLLVATRRTQLCPCSFIPFSRKLVGVTATATVVLVNVRRVYES